MTVTLKTNTWSLVAGELEGGRLKDRIEEAVEDSSNWNEVLTIVVHDDEVDEFHEAFEAEFGEPYVEGYDE